MEVSGEPFYSQAPTEYKTGWFLEPVFDVLDYKLDETTILLSRPRSR